MAKRARRRHGKGGRFLKTGASHSSQPKRRRRHHRTAAAANPPKRRRRRAALAHSSGRRRARRNPPAVKSIITNTIAGVQNGFAVVSGQVLARKIKGAAQGVLPATTNVSTGLPGVAVTSAAALAISIASAFLTPAKYRSAAEFVIAGAWSEAINQALAQTPVAPYLSAFSMRRVAAYPLANRASMRAYPAALPRSTGRVALSGYPTARVAGSFPFQTTGSV